MAITGAFIASKIPVTLGVVETMRCGLSAAWASPVNSNATRGKASVLSMLAALVKVMGKGRAAVALAEQPGLHQTRHQ